MVNVIVNHTTQSDEKLRHRICQLIIDEWQFLKATQAATRFTASE
jgi:hypothetical protein